MRNTNKYFSMCLTIRLLSNLILFITDNNLKERRDQRTDKSGMEHLLTLNTSALDEGREIWAFKCKDSTCVFRPYVSHEKIDM